MYLKWEEGNPLWDRAEGESGPLREDPGSVLFACDTTQIYGKFPVALLSLSLPSYPVNQRFVAYTWIKCVGKHDETISILRAGMADNPSHRWQEPLQDGLVA